MSGKTGFAPEVHVPMELTAELIDMVAQWPTRFTSKFAIVAGCWEWTAAKHDYGYGRYGRGGRNEGVELAHRMSLILAGQDVSDSFVDHLCRNPPCVRPDHLDAVTHTINVRRGMQSNVAGICRAGLHPWIPENITTEPNGTRRCTPCRDHRERKRSAARTQARRARRVIL